jgi:hypothetical protein
MRVTGNATLAELARAAAQNDGTIHRATYSVRGEESQLRKLAAEAGVSVEKMTYTGWFRSWYDMKVSGDAAQLMALGKLLERASGKWVGEFAAADVIEKSTMRGMNTDFLTDPGIRGIVGRSAEQVLGVGRGTRVGDKALTGDRIRAGVDRQLDHILKDKWQIAWGEAFSGKSLEDVAPGFALSPAANQAYQSGKRSLGRVFGRTIEIEGRTLEIVLQVASNPLYDRIFQVFQDGKLEIAGRLEFAKAGNPASIDWNARLPRKVPDLLDDRARSVLDAFREIKGTDEELARHPVVAQAMELTFGEHPPDLGSTKQYPYQSLSQLVSAAIDRASNRMAEEPLNQVAGEGKLTAEAFVNWMAQTSPAGEFGSTLVCAIAARTLPDFPIEEAEKAA